MQPHPLHATATVVLTFCALTASTASVALESCADEAAQASTISELAKQATAMDQLQRQEWTRFLAELDRKSSIHGWDEAKRQEVIQAPLKSPVFMADEILLRPHRARVEEYVLQLKEARASNNYRDVCISAPYVREAFQRLLEIRLRQYKLVFQMLSEE